MDNDTGWIRMYREILDKPIWQKSSPEQKTVLVTILLMVWHKSNKWEWNGEKYECHPGQIVSSLARIAQKCGDGVSIQNVRTAIKRFEKLNFLTNESTKTGRLITIVNWELYQAVGEDANKKTNKELTKTSQRVNKDLTTNKNVKNDKNVRMGEDIVIPGGPPPNHPHIAFASDSFEMQCVDYLIVSCLETCPHSKVPDTLEKKQKWAVEIDRMKRLDGLSEDVIKRTLHFATHDSFWRTNIRSAKKFREKFEVLYSQSQGKQRGGNNTGLYETAERLNRIEEKIGGDYP